MKKLAHRAVRVVIARLTHGHVGWILGRADKGDVQAIIQASWNWPDHRKDLEIFGTHGSVFTPDGRNVRMRLRGEQSERAVAPRELPAQYADGFAYLAAVVRGTEQVANTDRSSLANNLIVVQILDAARRSARTGQTVSVQRFNAMGSTQKPSR